MPPAKYCNALHCETRPVCYTDFGPHYQKNMTLTEMIVGQTQWKYEDGKKQISSSFSFSFAHFLRQLMNLFLSFFHFFFSQQRNWGTGPKNSVIWIPKLTTTRKLLPMVKFI
jgi:hypothetical protein